MKFPATFTAASGNRCTFALAGQRVVGEKKRRAAVEGSWFADPSVQDIAEATEWFAANTPKAQIAISRVERDPLAHQQRVKVFLDTGEMTKPTDN